MSKIYTCSNHEVALKVINEFDNIKFYDFNGHPSNRSETTKSFLEKVVPNVTHDFLIYDIVALNYIPLWELWYIKDDLTVVSFEDNFSDLLTYMSVGEILFEEAMSQ